jgi:ferrous iron transport protein A
MFGRRGHGGPPASSPLPAEGSVLSTLANGERAVITGVVGGGQLQARLENMGLRPGKEIIKLGAMPSAGPITVECDGFRVALGCGIARRVMVRNIGSPAEADHDRGEASA